MERVIRLRLAVLFLEKFAEAAIFPFMALLFAERLGTGTAGLLIFAAFAGAAAYLTPVPLPLLLGATIKLSYFDARGRAEAIRLGE